MISIVFALVDKFVREQVRDPLVLGLTLLTAPVFVIFYGLMFGAAENSAFDSFVPSLLIFAVIMLIFASAMSIAREMERGTLERLRLSSMTPLHYLLATSLVQGVLGFFCVGLTFMSALAMGFQSEGSIALAFGVTAVAGIASVGVGVLVASLSSSVNQAFLISSAFMFLLLLFSGAVLPLPELSTISVLGFSIGPLDVLPTVHAVGALTDVLMLGKGLEEIAPSLGAMFAISSLVFALGWWLFARRVKVFVSRGHHV